MTESIAGVCIPDSALAAEATTIIRDTTTELIYHHSRRVYLFGALQAEARGLHPDAELLYVAAMFHDTGLVAPYRRADQRFELDGADVAAEFLSSHGIPELARSQVWTAIALHTTPEIPYRMDDVVAATTAGVETDVLGLRLDVIGRDRIAAVTEAHPRSDFKRAILEAFRDGFEHRPATTFGTVNADVLEHFVPGFHRIDFVDVITDSEWLE